MLMGASQPLENLFQKGFYYWVTQQAAAAQQLSKERPASELLDAWNEAVVQITDLDPTKDIVPCYQVLFELVNDTEEVCGQFSSDPSLVAIVQSGRQPASA